MKYYHSYIFCEKGQCSVPCNQTPNEDPVTTSLLKLPLNAYASPSCFIAAAAASAFIIIYALLL